MASWNEWFVEAEKTHFKERGFNLDDFMPIRVLEDAERLYSSGLPVFERLFFDGAKYDKQKAFSFLKKFPLNWMRIQPKYRGEERFSPIGLNAQQAINYIDNLKVNLERYIIQLFESDQEGYGGNIISDNERTLVEIAKGSQLIVGRNLGPSHHADISPTGCIRYFETDVPEDIRRVTHNALGYLKLSRGEYMQGYFEFVVSPKNRVVFLDYKNPFERPKLRLDDEVRA